MTTKSYIKKHTDTPFTASHYPVPVVRIEQKTAMVSVLLAATEYGVLCIDSSSRIVEMNAVAAEVFDLHIEKTVGAALSDLPDGACDALTTPYKEAQRYCVETMSLTLCGAKPGKPGSFVQWNSRFIPVADAEGYVHFVVVLSSPVSDTQALMEERDAFLALLGHTVRTPITALNAYLTTLERTGTDRKIVNNMRSVTLALAKQTDNMLLAADIVAGNVHMRRKPLNIRDLLDALAADVGTGRIPIVVRGVRNAVVRADRKYLSRALRELLENALAFSTKDDAVSVFLRAYTDRVCIHIQDKGTGIESADIPHVFDRYHRVSGSELHGNSGIGLGLYLAKEIVTRHDGTIHIESDRGNGTTLTLTLPTNTIT